jgi:inosine/xanthosine triphosphate pyrophosphatase family protein
MGLCNSPDGKELLVRGEVCGHIATDISPVEGFAYDRLFIPTGYSQTFSELGLDAKAGFSHRARAATALLDKDSSAFCLKGQSSGLKGLQLVADNSRVESNTPNR